MKLITSILILFFVMPLSAQQLSEYQWKNRLVVIVATEEGLPMLQEQLTLLNSEQQELADRKLLICQLMEEKYRIGVSTKEWQAGCAPNRLNESIPSNTPFTIFLIGLDGGAKMQQTRVVQPQEIYDMIDQMPMRRAELRRG
ncbi:MAG: DUF4174 domain-containing protein [Bacteroidota bacterium]